MGGCPTKVRDPAALENLEVFAGSLVPAALRQVPFNSPDGSKGVDLYLDREAFAPTSTPKRPG
jgi:hypothetical protein